MRPKGKRRLKPGNKVVHLHTQADRARRLAAKCGSELVADLLETHAQLCERNADHIRGKPQSSPEPSA